MMSLMWQVRYCVNIPVNSSHMFSSLLISDGIPYNKPVNQRAHYK